MLIVERVCKIGRYGCEKNREELIDFSGTNSNETFSVNKKKGHEASAIIFAVHCDLQFYLYCGDS